MKNYVLQNGLAQSLAQLVILSNLFLISCTGIKTTDQEQDEGFNSEALIAQMTLDEKIGLLHGNSSFTTGGVERLGIPEIVMSDGPHGVRHEHGRDWDKDETTEDSTTYLPVGQVLAQTWNRDLGYAFGKVLGSEARSRGKDIILGPGINIIRTPLNGRNFEYLSEDPVLSGEMAVGYIKGVQEQDVATCIKHFVANNQELNRFYVDVDMSDKALHEIYFKGFKIAMDKADPYTVMMGYNKVRGDYCSESEFLINETLRRDWGYEGVAISDWNALHDAEKGIRAGLDIEMGTDLGYLAQPVIDYDQVFNYSAPLKALVESGKVSESLVDAKVRRVLALRDKLKMNDPTRLKGSRLTDENRAVARKVAEEGMVLLKNDGILPINLAKVKRIAVIGENANKKFAGRGGSSQVKAQFESTPLEGIKNALSGTGVVVDYVPGYTVDRNFKSLNPKMLRDATLAASRADLVIYVGGLFHGWTDEWADNAYDAEAADRPDMRLPFGQEDLISAIANSNRNLIGVFVSGGPIEMPFLNRMKAIVQQGYAGTESGNVLADILLGAVNPSGHLTVTYPKSLKESPAHAMNAYNRTDSSSYYKEGTLVGYRYFDAKSKPVLFPFGHGLSYTSFEYSPPVILMEGDELIVQFDVKNTGKRIGKDVAQLYVEAPGQGYKELKGFEKFSLSPGEESTFDIIVPFEDLQVYDETVEDWIMAEGQYTIYLGTDAMDNKRQATIEIRESDSY